MQILMTAILPIFLLVILGAGFKRYVFKNIDFWDDLDKLTYYVLVPSMLFYKISKANIDGTYDAFICVSVIYLILVAISVICIALNIYLKLSGSSFTSLYQGCIRFNSYIYLAIIDQFLGSTGIAVAAFIIAFAVPVVNILSVSVFGFFIKDKKFSILLVFRQISQNPFVLACVAGGAVNFFQLELYFFSNTLYLLGSSAITMGLISIGAGLRFKAIKITDKVIFLSCLLKLMIFPILTYILCRMISLPDIFMISCVLFSAMPTATSSYVLAGQLGGDKNLMSFIIITQTIICFFSIWLILELFSKNILG